MMKKYSHKNDIYADYQNDIIDIYEVIKQFDKLTSEKNKSGVVYTPGDIAEAMVERVQPKIGNNIIEFCVGHGVFVFALLKYFKKNNISAKEIEDFLENRLYAHDIDSQSVLEFKEILEIFLQKEFNISKKLKLKNVFAFNSLEYISGNKTFDVSLGNPPYIRFQNLSESDREFLQKNFAGCKSGNVDIYFAFLEMAAKVSDKAIHIVPNSYLKNKSAKGLRKILKGTVSYIKDFKSEQVFENVGVYASIIFNDKTREDDNFLFECDGKNQTVSKSELVDDAWNLENVYEIAKLKQKKNAFKDKITFYSGLATIADGVFILKTKPVDGFVKAKVGDQEFLIEEAVTKKYLKVSKVKSVSDIDKFTYTIIYPYNNEGQILPEEELKKKFPGAYAYLCANRERLDKRDKGKVDRYEAWYAYGRRQGFPAKYKGDIVLVPGMIRKTTKFVILSNSEEYLFGSGYFLAPKPGIKLNEIQKAISSPKFFEYVSLTGKVWKGKSGDDYFSPNKVIILGYCY